MCSVIKERKRKKKSTKRKRKKTAKGTDFFVLSPKILPDYELRTIKPIIFKKGENMMTQKF